MTGQSPSEPTYLVVGTAGHIDHGKTSLVKALTGIDTDTQPEEKARGLTIDLGFAFLDAENSDGSTLRISFVDVPGHKRFVRNMLAGAGGIHCVLFVIAADDGIRPQTIEHFEICRILGITRGVTVITKVDAVSEDRLRDVENEVRAFLSGTFLDTQRNPLLRASSLKRTGLQEITNALREIAQHLPEASSAIPVRLPVDRSFSITGAGTVVTGTLLSGSLVRGQSLYLQPAGREVRIKNIQIHSSHVEQVSTRTRVAVNLSGVDRHQAKRGDILVAANQFPPADLIDVEVSLLPAAPALKQRAMVHLHVFAGDVMAQVRLYSQNVLGAGMKGFARFKLMSPMLVARGDRFVLRQPSPAGTIGGGVVVEAHPLKEWKKQKSLDWLTELNETQDRSTELCKRVARRGMQGLIVQEAAWEMWLRETAVIEGLLPALTQNHSVELIDGTLLVTATHYQAAGEHFSRQLAQLLKVHRAERSVRKAELVKRCDLPPSLFASILERGLRERTLRAAGDEITVAGDDDGGNADEQRVQQAILAAFKKAAWGPRSIPEVLAELGLNPQAAKPLVTQLLRQKQLVSVDGHMYLHHETVAALPKLLSPYRNQVINVQQFKDLTGLSRKHAIPLLEFLDRSHLTRRNGDSRLVL